MQKKCERPFMEQYRVKIYAAAAHDFIKITDYINTFSQDAAERFHSLITERIASLSQMPERCPLVRNPSLRFRGYRSLIVGDYLVFYVISGKLVQIRRILSGKQDYEWML